MENDSLYGLNLVTFYTMINMAKYLSGILHDAGFITG